MDDVHSVLGRASLRVGTTFTSGNVALQPFVVGSVFREFAGNVKSRFSGDDADLNNTGGFTPSFSSTGDISTSRIGTYGHIGVGLAGVVLDTGWLGYARVDYRSGENIESVTANAGIRYQFTPPKDMDVSLKDAQPYRHLAKHNWTSIYGGFMSGVVSGRTDFQFVDGTDTSPDPAGYLLGGTLGANWQTGHLVFGVEGDLGWANAEGGQACRNPFFYTCTANIDSLGIVSGRLGFAWDRALIYTKAGVAFADVSAGFDSNGGPIAAGTQNLDAGIEVSKTLTGLALGVGIEFAFSQNWSGKVEYMRVEFDNERFNATSPFDLELKIDTVRAGINYHFGHRGHDYHHEPVK